MVPQVFELWPEGNPVGWSVDGPEIHTEENGILIVRNVNQPTVTFNASATAKPGAPTVLVVPGGGYNLLALGHEGSEIAEWLNKNGIHAAVLKYRLPKEGDVPRHGVSLQDAQQAMRLLREKAASLGINPGKLGAMGFSAGGHLSAMLALDPSSHQAPRSAPDFVVLIYPAYLQGDPPLSGQTLGKEAPPAFLLHTLDDHIPIQSSLAYLTACQKAGVQAEAHFYPVGGHGYALRTKEPGLRDWPSHLLAWLRRR
jgi:acetyl esterase/lipase